MSENSKRKIFLGIDTSNYTTSVALCDEDGVLAVPGICLRDGSLPHPGEKTLYVRIYFKKQTHFE